MIMLRMKWKIRARISGACKLLASTDITLPTYEKNGHKSTLDYKFTNSQVTLMKTNVRNLLNSNCLKMNKRPQLET